jgi:hypothetical protein
MNCWWWSTTLAKLKFRRLVQERCFNRRHWNQNSFLFPKTKSSLVTNPKGFLFDFSSAFSDIETSK